MNYFLLINIIIFLRIIPCFAGQTLFYEPNYNLFKAIQSDDTYQCWECQEKFSDKKWLGRHMSQKHEENIFGCTSCDHRCSLDSTLHLHYYKIHRIKPSRKCLITCGLCMKDLNGEIAFFKHIKKEHSEWANTITSLELFNENLVKHLYKACWLSQGEKKEIKESQSEEEIIKQREMIEMGKLKELIIGSIERIFKKPTD